MSEFFLYTFNKEGKSHCLASPLLEPFVTVNGLTSEATAGEFVKGKEQASVENFNENPVFVGFLQWVIAKHIHDWPTFAEEAKKKQSGKLFVTDIRLMKPTPEAPDVPEEDVIGIVSVEDGKAVEFQGNVNYKVYTDKGFCQLDPWLFEKYLEELEALGKQGHDQLTPPA